MTRWMVLVVCAVTACGDDARPPGDGGGDGGGGSGTEVLSVVAAPRVILGDGAPRAAVTAYLDADATGGTPLAGREVDFTVTGSTGATLSRASGTTDASGRVVAMLAATVGGTATVHASAGALVATADVQVTAFAVDCAGAPAMPMLPSFAGGNVAIADLDGDGIPDAIGEDQSTHILVQRGLGHGLFGAPTSYAVGNGQATIATGELDGLAGIDVAVASSANGGISVFHGNGDGTLGAAVLVGAGTLPMSIAIGDFDHDGANDLAVVMYATPPVVEIAWGHGDGTFADPVVVGTLTGSPQLAMPIIAIDVDADGDDDLVAMGEFGPVVLRDVHTRSPSQFGVTFGVRDVNLVDLDGDSLPELVGAGYPGVTGFLVAHNLGNGAFAAPQTIDLGHQTYAIAVGDFDGDGFADVAATTDDPADPATGVTFALGRGDLTFAAGPHYDAPRTFTLAAADVDGDGVPDLLARSPDRTAPLRVTRQPLAFAAPPRFATGGRDVAALDYDGDGAPDLASIGGGAGSGGEPAPTTLRLARGHGDGGFDAEVTVELHAEAVAIAGGDLDRDGLDDAVAVTVDGMLHVLMATGGATPLVEQRQLAVGGSDDVRLVDLDGDGYLDAVLGGEGAIVVMRGGGDGTFAATATLPTGVSGLALGDVDGDGLLDIVGTSGTGAQLFRGHGDGTFAPATAIGAGEARALGDFDGDHHLDLAVQVMPGIGDPGKLLLYPGHGDGTFGAPIQLDDGSTSPTAFVDVDRDGAVDLLAQRDDIVRIFRRGQPPLDYAITERVFFPRPHVAIADFDRDGALDFAFVEGVVLHETACLASVASAYLKASNTDPGDVFGAAVAISADGRTLAVGAPNEASAATGVGGDQGNDPVAAPGFGAVYVFAKSGTSWVQQAYVKSPTGQQGWVGSALALSARGDTLVVGGYQDHEPSSAGGAYAYVRDAATGTWSYEAELVSPAATMAGFFGWSIALSADGNTAAVGAYDEDSVVVSGGQSFSGFVHVFVRDPSTHAWSHQAALASPHVGPFAYVGWSVALADDGDTLAFGATGDPSGASDVGGDETDTSAESSGAVFVFGRAAGAWTEQGYLKAPHPVAHAQLGTRLALAPDGSTLAAYEPGVSGAGAVYLFERGGTNEWFAQGAVPGASGGRFGAGLAFGDARTLAIGAPDDGSAATGGGAVAIYEGSLDGEFWTRDRTIVAPVPRAQEAFGTSVAIGGGALVVGAPGEASHATGVGGDETDQSAPNAGAAFVQPL